MQRNALTLVMAALVFAIGCAHLPLPAPIDAGALAAMQAYQYGDNRETLTRVEDMVRDAANGPDNGKALAAELAALLGERGTTRDAQQFICRQLRLIGTEDEVPAIAPLLSNPNTSDMARYALEVIPGASADSALLQALANTSGTTRAGVINTLGNRRAGASRDALQALTADRDPVVAHAAAAALERLGS